MPARFGLLEGFYVLDQHGRSPRGVGVGRRVSVAIIIPCRGLAAGKQRLAARLDPAARTQLNQWLLTNTIYAAGAALGEPEQCFVVSPDPIARRVATSLGVAVIDEPPGIGLNAALALARLQARQAGATIVIVLPVDLPRLDRHVASDLVARSVQAAAAHRALIAPDAGATGTNALALDARLPFTFGFGLDSCALHYAEASRHGLGVTRYDVPQLAFDLDWPGDYDRWMVESPQAAR